jgi:hypothetical protein
MSERVVVVVEGEAEALAIMVSGWLSGSLLREHGSVFKSRGLRVERGGRAFVVSMASGIRLRVSVNVEEDPARGNESA